MNSNTIIEQIDNEIKKISNKKYNKILELNELSRITNDNKNFTINNLFTDTHNCPNLIYPLSLSDYLIASVIVSDDYIDLENLLEEIKKQKSKIDNISCDMMKILIRYFEKVNREDSVEIIKKLLEDKRVLKDLTDSDEVISKSFILILKLFTMSKKMYIDLITTIYDIAETKNVYKEFSEDIKNFMDADLRSRDIKSLNNTIKKQIYAEYEIDKINKDILTIKNYQEKLSKEYKKLEKNKNINIENLQNLKKILIKSETLEEITDIDHIVSLCTDNLKPIILNYISNKNTKYYEKLEKDYLYSKANSIGEYVNLFEKYGINFCMYSVDIQKLIIEKGIENVELILEFLTKINFDSYLDISNIIINTNLKIIEQLKLYITKNFITFEFLKNNPLVLLDNAKNTNSLYNLLILNICTLVEENINVKGLENLDILLQDTELIKNNIEICKNHNINIKTRNLNDYIFLSNSNLENKINYLVNIGININCNLDSLNSDDNIIKRIEICKLINVPICNEEGVLLDSIIHKDKFFLSDQEITESSKIINF